MSFVTAGVSTLHTFYETPLGEWVRFTLGRKIKILWPSAHRELTLGVGYTAPYMPFLKKDSDGAPLLVFKPEEAAPWPSHSKNRVILGCEEFFPFADGQFDKILMVHGIELSSDPAKLLREMWRILKAEGELLLIVPHYSHSWMHRKGIPWEKAPPLFQIERLLRQAFFELLAEEKALFLPLFRSAIGLKTFSPFVEKMGEAGLWPFAGVWIMKARKQVYQLTLKREQAHKAGVIFAEEAR